MCEVRTTVTFILFCILLIEVTTPKTAWYNFIKIGPLWLIFHIKLLAFSCGLIVFKEDAPQSYIIVI